MTCIDATTPRVSPNRPLLLVVAAALIDADGRVLLAERPAGKNMAGLWEFPGGKVHSDETPEAALVRELHEELGIETSAGDFSALTFASHAYPDFHLLMPVFACHVWSGTPQAKEDQRLVWVTELQMKDYPMPPADVVLARDLWKLL